jgi:leader peptidase (prepilin peptidase)/N-methyltransferase
MLALRLIVCVVLAIPAGWFAGLLADRVPAMGRTTDGERRDPHALALFADLPGLRLDGRYLWIVIGQVLMYGLTAYKFHDDPAISMVPYLVMWCGLLALVATDLEWHRLPDRIVLPTLVLGVVSVVIASVVTKSSVSIRYALLGAGAYFGILLVFHLIYPGFAAFGDVKTGAILGLAIGWQAADYTGVAVLVFYAILLAYVLSAVVGVGIVITQGGISAARRRRIGMAPWMVSAAFVIVMFSSALA